MLVVTHHSTIEALNAGVPATMMDFMGDFGSSGVDIFFVISGFIMVYIQHNKNYSIKTFYLERVIRIAPLYWVLTFLYLFAHYLINHEILSINYLIHSLLFINQSPIGAHQYPVLYVGWSLEYEMFFYLIFGLSIYLFNKNSNVLFITIPVITLLTAFTIFFASSLLILEFLLGMVVAHLYLIDYRNKLLSYSALVIGFILLITSMFYNFEIDRFFKWGLPSALLLYGAITLKQLQNKTLIYSGSASYSIYLVQVFSIPLFYKLTVYLFDSFNANLAFVICLIFTWFAGLFIYTILEKPMIKLIKNTSFAKK